MFTLTSFVHRNVDVDGATNDGTFVPVHGALYQNETEFACASKDACSCAPTRWICKFFPRTAEGIVVGFTVRYASAGSLEVADLLAIQTEIQQWTRLPEWTEVALRVQEEVRSIDRATASLLSRL